jgi:hypothetical protein
MVQLNIYEEHWGSKMNQIEATKVGKFLTVYRLMWENGMVVRIIIFLFCVISKQREGRATSQVRILISTGQLFLGLII